MTKVIYAGDGGGEQIFIVKGAAIHPFLDKFVGSDLHQKLAENPNLDVTYMDGTRAYHDFPRTAEQLKQYDVLILSDVAYDTLALYAGITTIGDLEKAIAPNRLKEIKKYVTGGGGLLYCGGWFSFQGRQAVGNWYDTPVADVLPVEILPVPDDRVESPEGVRPNILEPTHPTVANIHWNECPPFLGYNRVGSTRNGASLIATIGDNDPFIAVWKYGEGRVMAFTSDPCPHWGMGFVKWRYYSKFWSQVLRWLAKEI